MTMQNLPHPDDELLAAYAGGEPDVLADTSLLAHLSTCDRCRPLVDELSLLRGALAELPDLAPSRPLRLIPPVPTPAPAAARGFWLRRLTAPAMAVGVALVLAGAVGIGASGTVRDLFRFAAFSNVGGNLQGAGTGATDRGGGLPVPAGMSPTVAPGDTTSGGPESGSSEVPKSLGSAQPPSPRPSAANAGRTDAQTGNTSSQQPWLTLMIAGAGLFGISVVLRFSLTPRAG